MKKGMWMGILVCLAMSVYGESFTIKHDFKTMGSSRITYTDGNKTGTTDSVVYHCYKNATFGTYNGNVHILMANRNDSVVTSKIEGLKWFQFHYNTASAVDLYETISVKISRDGSSWTDMSSAMNHGKNLIDIVIPRRGDYFVKIINTGSGADKKFYLDIIQWHIELCNCFEYIPE